MQSSPQHTLHGLGNKEAKAARRGRPAEEHSVRSTKKRTIDAIEESGLRLERLDCIFWHKQDFESADYFDNKISRRKLTTLKGEPGCWLKPSECKEFLNRLPDRCTKAYAEETHKVRDRKGLYKQDESDPEVREGLGDEVWHIAKEAGTIRTK